MYKKINNCNIYYRVINKYNKKTIIFIHGLGSDNSCFRDYLKYFSDYKIILFDLAGFGKSKNNRSYNLSEEITLTVEFIKRLNLENYYIIAYSLGGIIALQYLLQEIKLVKKLVLINTPLTLMNINRNRRLYLILRYYLGFILPFKLLAKIICFNLFSDNRKFAHIFYQQIISSDRKTYKNIVKDLKYYDVINQLNKENKINLLAQLNKKILYIYGNKDQLIDGNTQLKISKAIHHKLIEGNHGLFLEKQVKEVSKASLNFFTKIN